jgi:hypothetical protein
VFAEVVVGRVFRIDLVESQLHGAESPGGRDDRGRLIGEVLASSLMMGYLMGRDLVMIGLIGTLIGSPIRSSTTRSSPGSSVDDR